MAGCGLPEWQVVVRMAGRGLSDRQRLPEWQNADTAITAINSPGPTQAPGPAFRAGQLGPGGSNRYQSTPCPGMPAGSSGSRSTSTASVEPSKS